MTPDELLQRLEAPLSLRRRVLYLTVGLAGLTGSALIALLWATEPALPTRTQAAFAVLITIGLGWAAFGAWAVTRRAPLYARDRVVAAGLALAAWLLFAAGATAIARHQAEPWPIIVVALLGAAATANLVRARRARAELQQRRKPKNP
jgi:hypothetical protein